MTSGTNPFRRRTPGSLPRGVSLPVADPPVLFAMPPPEPVVPPNADALFARGNAQWQAGERAAAVASYEAALALRPDHADARNNLGNALLELGRAAEAVAHYRTALVLRPRHAPTLYNLGNALLASGDAGAAVDPLRDALALDPDHAGAHNNLGNALRALGRIAEAEACYRHAVRLRPGMAGSHNNLGAALLAQHRPAEAAGSLLEALRLQPDYAEACNNLGGAMLALDRPEEAIGLFRRAVALDADLPQADFGEAMALLTLGRLTEGWAAYESRWRDPAFCADERSYPVKLWLNRPGESLAGQTIVLHAEQGLGDTIQFVRYAPLVRALGAHVVLEAQAPLLPLLGGLADTLIASGAELPPCGWHCPLMSLPLAFGTDLATIPGGIPYLGVPVASRVAWARRLGPRRRLRVGIAFSGSPEHPEDALRSIPAALLLPLLARPDAEFHVVQKDIRPADAEALRMAQGVRSHAERLRDFGETAGLLAQMDLLISADTSVAHLAGALGLPVWIMLQFSADFRWLRGRRDSPWYPTARLFRQGAERRWEPVLAQVAEALRDFRPAR